jgi:hypothetical protein
MLVEFNDYQTPAQAAAGAQKFALQKQPRYFKLA